MDKDALMHGEIIAENINIGLLTDNKNFGHTSFSIVASGTETINNDGKNSVIGNIYGQIKDIEYLNYKYTGIDINAFTDFEGYGGEVNVNDENIKLNLSGRIDTKTKVRNCDLRLIVNEFRPYALNFTKNYAGDNFSFNATTILNGNYINEIEGEIQLDSIKVSRDESVIPAEYLHIAINKNSYNEKSITKSAIFYKQNML